MTYAIPARICPNARASTAVPVLDVGDLKLVEAQHVEVVGPTIGRHLVACIDAKRWPIEAIPKVSK